MRRGAVCIARRDVCCDAVLAVSGGESISMRSSTGPLRIETLGCSASDVATAVSRGLMCDAAFLGSGAAFFMAIYPGTCDAAPAVESLSLLSGCDICDAASRACAARGVGAAGVAVARAAVCAGATGTTGPWGGS